MQRPSDVHILQIFNFLYVRARCVRLFFFVNFLNPTKHFLSLWKNIQIFNDNM